MEETITSKLRKPVTYACASCDATVRDPQAILMGYCTWCGCTVLEAQCERRMPLFRVVPPRAA